MLFKTYSLEFIIREHYVVPAVILVSSLVLWVFNFEINTGVKKLFKSASSLGAISYGVYMIHMPIIYFFGRTEVGSWPMFVLKLTGYAAVLIGTAYLLELKFQPYIKKILRKNENPRATSV